MGSSASACGPPVASFADRDRDRFTETHGFRTGPDVNEKAVPLETATQPDGCLRVGC